MSLEPVSPTVGGHELDADVCVIGAGPVGLGLTDALAQAGVRVLVLESGDATATRGNRQLAAGENVGYPYFKLHTTRVRALGGTSHLWGPMLRARPFGHLDFEPREGVPHSGWPIRRGDLDRHYAAAQQVMALGPDTYELEPWRERSPLTPLPLGPAFDQGVFQFAPPGSQIRELAQRLGDTPGVRIVTGATVLELDTDDDGDRIVAAAYVDGEGRAARATARAFVLAGGSIANARLLLASNRRWPAGIGNHHDNVGRYFMEHPAIRSGVLTPAGAPPDVRFYDKHAVDGTTIQGMLALREDIVREHALLKCSFFLLQRDRAYDSQAVHSLGVLRLLPGLEPAPPGRSRHVAAVARGAPQLLAGAVRVARHRGHSGDSIIVLRTIAEQAPNPDSRVTLSDRRDRFGMPQPRLDWRFTELDRRSLRTTQELIDHHLRAAGIGRVERMLGDLDEPELFVGQWHHMGTTRMHADPRHGVVDADARVHGTTNLYATGASVFATGGAVNPTLTAVAFGLRLADHLAIQRLRPTAHVKEQP